MTHSIHVPHESIPTHGLDDACPRCAELAADPVRTLDDTNLRRIIRLAVSRDRLAEGLTHLDLVASVNVLSLLERSGHLYRVAPLEVAAFLDGYAWRVSPK